MGASLLQIAFLALCAFAAAHPGSYIKQRSDDQCNSLPDRAYGKHGRPSSDRDTIISLLQSGKVQKDYCPGRAYTLKVDFPAPRLGLMVSNMGNVSTERCTDEPWSTKRRCCVDKSGVRWILQESQKTRMYEENIWIPCNAKGGLLIQVASADGAHDGYHLASQAFPKAAKCAACQDPPAVVKEQDPKLTVRTGTSNTPRLSHGSETHADPLLRHEGKPVANAAPQRTDGLGTVEGTESRGWTKQHGGDDHNLLAHPDDKDDHPDEKDDQPDEHDDDHAGDHSDDHTDDPADDHADDPSDDHADDPAGDHADDAADDDRADGHSDDQSDGLTGGIHIQTASSDDHSDDRPNSPSEDHSQHHHEDDPSESERVAPPRLDKAMIMKPAHMCPQRPAGDRPAPYSYHNSAPIHPLLTLHWSYSACVPSNPCTTSASWRVPAPKQGPILHIMAVANTSGYVSVGFGSEADQMVENDVVLGYTSDTASSVEAYAVSSKHLHTSDAYPHEAGLAVYAGVLQTSDKRTIICFARHLKAPSAKYTPKLPLHTQVAVNWAIGDKDKLSFHSHMGGVKLSLGDRGAHVGVVHRGGTARRLHGAAMLLAWLVLMPLGVMCARHRWWFGERNVNQTQTWFLAHQGFNAVGLMLQFSSGALALFVFNASPGLGSAHKAMGIITMMLALLQVGGAVARPKAGTRMRPAWFLGHQTFGGVLLVMSWISCGLGMLLMHAKYLDSLLAWFVPCIGVVVLLVALDFFLQQQKNATPFSPGKAKFARKDVALPEFQRLRDLPDDF